VFSDVSAVLNKHWKENHHARLCEILADVERECGVKIYFVRGAYQFRGTLEAISAVAEKLGRESDRSCDASSKCHGDGTQSHMQHVGASSRGENPCPPATEVLHSSGVIFTQPTSCIPEKVVGLVSLTDGLTDRQNVEHDDTSRTLTTGDREVDGMTQHETQQVEGARSLPLVLSVDHIVGDQSAESLHSPSDMPVSDNCDSVRAGADEGSCHRNNNTQLTNPLLSQPDVTEGSSQAKEDCRESALEIEPHVQRELEASHHSVGKSAENELTNDSSHDTKTSCVGLPSETSTVISCSSKHVGNKYEKERSTKDLIYARSSTDLSTHRDQREFSIPLRLSGEASAGKCTDAAVHDTKTAVPSESSAIAGTVTPAADEDDGCNTRTELPTSVKVLTYARDSTDLSTES